MKIVLINNLYGRYQRGGAEKITEEMYINFTKANHKTSIITTLPYFKKKKKEEKNIYYIKSFYYYLNKVPLFLRLFWHLGEFLNFKKYKAIKTILKKENPDLIITHNLLGLGKLSFIAIKKSKKEHFHILHDIQLIHPSGLMILGEEEKINSFLSKIYYKINRKIAGSPELVISPSKWLLDIHAKLGFFNNSNKKIIPNPVNFNDSEISEINNENFNLLFAGQIENHKGINFLLEAFEKIDRDKNLKNKIKLNIAGNGKELEKYKKLYKNKSNIKFLGWLDENKLKKELKKTKLIIVPSICYENSPTIIYEAINFGIPVLASNIGGIPELITNKKEQLFKPADSLDLYDKIKKAFYNHKVLKNITNIERKEIKKLNSKNYIDEIIQLFKNTKENKI